MILTKEQQKRIKKEAKKYYKGNASALVRDLIDLGFYLRDRNKDY